MNVLEAIIQLRRALSRTAAAIFTDDISARQSVIMREIGACGSVSQVALARATAIDPSALVRLLDELTSRGMVERHRSEADRREMVVSLTAQGHKALKPLEAAHKRLADATAGALTLEERRIFVTLAAKIQTSLSSALNGGAAMAKVDHAQR